ncbi:MAG TPA: epimerase, partial [Isosphaeraceae bacterium]|nr:epimerase [Isosphaeraceae bacterium]
IWQGDASAMTLCAFVHASSPPFVLNITGPETLRVRDVAERFGRLLGREALFTGEEAPDALLSDSSLAQRLMGPPRLDADQLIALIADWLRRDGPSLDKPTRFEVRDGQF